MREFIATDLPTGLFPPSRADATHFGAEDLPFFTLLDGTDLQLLQVDLDQGLWVVRTRLQPGFVIDRHYHTGPVFAVTLKGRWYYEEYPEAVNEPGSYLFEPAGALHTLKVADDNEDITEIWFAVRGANIGLNADGSLREVVDAATVLADYRAAAKEAGADISKLMVTGE